MKISPITIEESISEIITPGKIVVVRIIGQKETPVSKKDGTSLNNLN